MTAKSEQSTSSQDLIITDTQDSVTTLTMNNSRRLNGWTEEMMDALKEGFSEAAKNEQTKVLVLTGADPYYCAGVNLASTFRFAHPRKLKEMIKQHNQALFDMFLDFPKPLLVAINGPAIGASVTSATLSDGIIASEKATFSTPFAALGVTAEGCSSVHFARLMGDKNAERMLGKEGWKPRAKEALEAGLIQWVVPHEKLSQEIKRITKKWVATGVERSFLAGGERDELKAINAKESAILSEAFFAAPFLKGQVAFLWRKKKLGSAAIFLTVLLLRPLWFRLL